jgi:acyl-CoA synthetase (AMP-forming)/AMP-acid ligase II
VLQLNKVTKNFGGLTALRDVSFYIKEGTIKGLIGPNGAGKTTLFNVITGVFPPNEGAINFFLKDITSKKPEEIACLGISRTFQQPHLFKSLTVWENVMLGRHYRTQVETGMLSVLRPEDHAERSHCTGREMFNVEMRIVNEDGQDTPIGEAGEIISKQWPTGMIAYHKMEKATGETIRDGWIHTGDVARVEEDGYFTIVGRTKDMIISGAENIYPKEIEDVLTSHSGVQEAVVIGIPDEIWGGIGLCCGRP